MLLTSIAQLRQPALEQLPEPKPIHSQKPSSAQVLQLSAEELVCSLQHQALLLPEFLSKQVVLPVDVAPLQTPSLRHLLLETLCQRYEDLQQKQAAVTLKGSHTGAGRTTLPSGLT